MKKTTGIRITALLSFILALLSVPVFSSSATLYGDVDGDNVLSASDSRIILRMSVGIEEADEKAMIIADLDSDGVISAEDARLSLRLALGIYEDESAFARTVYGNFAGFTEKHFPIHEQEGMTYIDGVLIANKSYSLPSSYNPGGLLPECTDAFAKMQSDARAKGLSIYISSGFRSYASQNSIYNRYVSRDGKRLADTYSARPGHSEHQTGLAIDLNTITQAFGNTAEGKWVAAHCHEYGFIIRYPKGKEPITGYCYEPWHLRYVGIDTATAIYESGLCLEEYFGITSVYA